MPSDPARGRPSPPDTREHERLAELHGDLTSWRRWGPYVAERAWGTVREDYSADGDAWDYLPHDLARSKAYRWGEDGLAGICDRYQLLVLRASRFWNGRDPILKERLFGLVPARGQPRRGRQGVLLLPRRHADALLHEVALQVPAARSIPYARLIEENRRRDGRGPGVRAARHRRLRRRPLLRRLRRVRQGRRPRTSCIRIDASSTAGPEAAPLHILPHLWFRNTWAWGEPRRPGAGHPAGARRATASVSLLADDRDARAARATCPSTTASARATSTPPAGGELLFTDNETQRARASSGRGAHEPQAVRQGRLPPPRRRRRGRASTPTQVGHQGLRCTTATCVPAGRLGRRSACG